MNFDPAGHHPPAHRPVPLRERLHVHDVVQAGPAQRRQHREGEALPVLVSRWCEPIEIWCSSALRLETQPPLQCMCGCGGGGLLWHHPREDGGRERGKDDDELFSKWLVLCGAYPFNIFEIIGSQIVLFTVHWQSCSAKILIQFDHIENLPSPSLQWAAAFPNPLSLLPSSIFPFEVELRIFLRTTTTKEQQQLCIGRSKP